MKKIGGGKIGRDSSFNLTNGLADNELKANQALAPVLGWSVTGTGPSLF
ncbi:hypothetical protein [Hymenobacter lapidarius]|nr:hypothetical protein [Hymenobacter lapidarius]